MDNFFIFLKNKIQVNITLFFDIKFSHLLFYDVAKLEFSLTKLQDRLLFFLPQPLHKNTEESESKKTKTAGTFC